MNRYRVTLVAEGESAEQVVFAESGLHAIRQALLLWHRYEVDAAVLSTEVIERDAQLPAHEPRRSVR